MLADAVTMSTADGEGNDSDAMPDLVDDSDESYATAFSNTFLLYIPTRIYFPQEV